MKYALIYSYDPAETSPTEGEVSDWLTLDQAIKDAGAHVYEMGLQSSERALTISTRGGVLTADDGPVVGTEGDVVAGFWLVDVENADAAVDWARKLPTASYGKVEIRAVVDYAG